MDHREVGRFWDLNAEVWTRLSRAGYDTYRDAFNTPSFLAFLPPIRGRRGLDLGCGEGTNTRRLARLGPRLTGVDIAGNFVRAAQEVERRDPLGIRYVQASAVELPFNDGCFDFVTAIMSLMDVAEADLVAAEVRRLLRPGGFFQFSVSHPCYDTAHRRNLRGPDGRTYAIEVGGYFDQPSERVAEWIFSSAPEEVKRSVRPFRVPIFHRTLSGWLNLLLDAGLRIERVAEPSPPDEVVREIPSVQDAQIVAYFLHVRARREGSSTSLDSARSVR